ncbi:YlbF family regulator [Staphylococcus sp. 17KM0847]|uniref:YlbF family regulator n=1 Tax=Staphylococcus sp. 17KM0847 TaxID=2583989 RepID=UPI0015DC71A4|nr:YlbF family regulator [Staphylococcus sp. 17KM0847]QLK86950.1 YlbF family regulator [Staphylococcus sp. 17KM0847]
MFDEQFMQVLDEIDALALLIRESDIYKRYHKAQKALMRDDEAQQHYQCFMDSKARYDEVGRFGRYHPDYHEVMLEVRRRKRVYECHETVAMFKQCEHDLQLLLDEVVTILAESVSEHVKVDAGTPLFNQGGGCGCGSGGSCQCQV